MKRVIIYVFLLTIIFVSFVSAEKLLYVIDGDTIKILQNNEKISVRFLGIDTFETKDSKRGYQQAKEQGISINEVMEFGERAKDYLKSIISDNVVLKYDKNNKNSGHLDKYDRLLAYVFTDKGLFLNEKMLEEGHALLLTQYPLEKKYSEKLLEAYTSAVMTGKGFGPIGADYNLYWGKDKFWQ